MKTKKKFSCIHIYNELFQINFYVFYGVKEESFKKDIKRIFDSSKLEKELRDGYTVVWKKKGNDIVVVWTRIKKVSVLAHELIHAISYVLITRGINLNEQTEEVYAYFMQELMRRILKKE